MKITKERLKQIIQEEMCVLIKKPMEGGCGGEEHEHEEHPQAADLSQMSGDEAFGFAWNKAIEFLRDGGMEDGASALEALSGPE